LRPSTSLSRVPTVEPRISTPHFCSSLSSRIGTCAGRVRTSPLRDGAALPPRAEWIAAARHADPTSSVRQLNRRYDTLKAADETNANVAALRAAGIDAVYLPCDVRDEHTVVVTLDEVRRRWGRVDGVLYGASTAGQLARLPALLRDGIETNLAVKVSGLVHVVRALESATPPWLVVFSSISSLGADGMATYAGTNAFQNSLVAHLRAAGWRAVAFNWPAWSGAGAAARDTALLEKMAAEQRFSVITPDEGRALLCDELARGMPSATVFLVGQPEEGFLARRFVSAWPLLDEVTRIDRNTLVARRTFSLKRDPWLGEHRVDGDPVLPGTFELEMAAEAACALDGARNVHAFEDIRFDLFVKLFGERPTVVDARAQRRPDGAVEVVITSDVLDRRGRVLVRARRHFSAVVRTGAPRLPPAPTLPLDARDARPVADPYHLPGASVVLTGRFVTLTDTTQGEGFTAARTRLDARARATPFDGFITPALLLDGVLRSAALQPDSQGALPVLAPLALARIDFYAEGNDLTLSARHGSLDVRFRIDGPIASGPGGRYEVSADGILLLSADDARGYIKSVVRPTAPDASVVLSLHTHPWLADAARFDGVAVLPGSFQLEIAASAALRRTPGARVVAVEEVRFERLLRLHPDRMYAVHIALTPRDRSRVEATLSARHPVEGHGEIRLSRMVVVLGDDAGPAPAPLLQGTALPEPHVPGALYMAASRLHLGGVFATVNGARSDGAVLTADVGAAPEIPEAISADHVIPPVLLDLVLQPCVRREDAWVTTCVPAAIRRVRLFVTGGDHAVYAAHGPLTLRAQRIPGTSNLRRSQVVGRDGCVLIEVEGFDTTELGWVNPATGVCLPTRPADDMPVDPMPWQLYEITTPPVPLHPGAAPNVRNRDLPERAAAAVGDEVVCRVTGPDGLEDIGELVDQLLQIGRAARGDGPRIRVAWGGGGEAAVAFTRAFVVSLAEESPRVSPELVGAPNGGLLRATPTEETAFALPPGAVVLITGGARGVTAVLARHLVARGARLVLLGRSTLEEGAADRPTTLGAFLAWHREQNPGSGMAEGRGAFERFMAARETLANVIALRACGDVAWVTADLRDASAVRHAVAETRARFGRVDALVHAAGVERSAALSAKTRGEVNAVISTKVDGLRHMLAAFDDQPPARVLLVGSVNGVLGAAGQTDYCAASAWLGAAAGELRRHGVAARCIALPAVRDVGMAARRPEVLEHLRAKGHRIFTADEAAALMLASLGDGPAYTLAAPPTLLAGRVSMGRDAPRATLASSRDETFDRVDRQGDVYYAERLLDTERDPMLLAHLAGGVPCLPGAAEVELVLQLVRRMGAPAIVRLENIHYRHFVKVFPGRPVRLRVQCVREGEVVRARILSDVLHRDGRVLVRDKEHWSGDVYIAAEHPPSPAPPGHSALSGEVTLPCYLAGAPLFYTSAMRSVTWRGRDLAGGTCARVDAGDRALVPWARELPWEVADALAITPIAPDGVVPVIDAMRRLELFAPVAAGIPIRPSTFWIRATRMVESAERMHCDEVQVIDSEGRVVARAQEMSFRTFASTALDISRAKGGAMDR
jgi:NAD(P)-dependent dehydrogenase (short-subunit alcohol dehydrogenase family)